MNTVVWRPENHPDMWRWNGQRWLWRGGDMSRNSANGSTRAWRQLRARKLAVTPGCEWPLPDTNPGPRIMMYCGAPAVEVDHIKPLKDGGDRFAWSNLRSLCADHHKLRHGKQPKPTIDPKTGLPTANHWWRDT